MELLKDRRVLLGGGAALALIAGLGIALALMHGAKSPTEAPPASRGGLVVETGRADDTKLDPARPLRCFVGGQFVGETTLAECANKNGVATGALDVGVDETGALAAADQAGLVLTPLPPPAEAPTVPAPAATPAAQTPAVSSTPLAVCWRYAGGEWRKLPGEITVNACAQQISGGKCERAGGATYGRWGDETLRLVPGRVESSSDNRTFHSIIELGPNCSIPSA
ncbi:hypothetical protein ASD38_11145 [Caulobacter sp. Root487D2Y]|uniref:hypothetical protein n=1 Tax=Caulobacter sp. Root487D2Y TaxID=1736547 RepID=UPI0006F7B0E8|nr:hypothetical protein [Caulobacter sp. Root487D2Y]KQY29865.1 hypothetical protein ASD38_11145 [Caulobacter sp. Root487D2Y]